MSDFNTLLKDADFNLKELDYALGIVKETVSNSSRALLTRIERESRSENRGQRGNPLFQKQRRDGGRTAPENLQDRQTAQRSCLWIQGGANHGEDKLLARGNADELADHEARDQQTEEQPRADGLRGVTPFGDCLTGLAPPTRCRGRTRPGNGRSWMTRSK